MYTVTNLVAHYTEMKELIHLQKISYATRWYNYKGLVEYQCRIRTHLNQQK